MKETKEQESTIISNEEYRKRLNEIFDGMDENYKLRWFYNFITRKIESSN